MEPSLGSAATSHCTASTPKPIHSLVLDTGPLIKNDPSVSVLLSKAESLFTIPSVIPEIRDPATRSRVETTLLPFVTLRLPKPESVRFILGFSRRTGDLAVLSRSDLELLALCYELECERNGGDWRLRNTPGQKSLNGRSGSHGQHTSVSENPCTSIPPVTQGPDGKQQPPTSSLEAGLQKLDLDETDIGLDSKTTPRATKEMESVDDNLSTSPNQSPLGHGHLAVPHEATTTKKTLGPERVEEDTDSDDSDDWITPSNVHKHRTKDTGGAAMPTHVPQKTLQAAILTSDYAMQNVALQINLNLVTPALSRISRLKNWVLRCHGCFSITKDMDKQFCPSCGQPTLLRTSCSTDEHGIFRLHLKKNFQWIKRGNVYSVPRPVHGTANGRLPKNAGGKNGWGRDLILAEDQKEYVRATEERRRAHRKDLMDDSLPGILSGDRSGGMPGRIRVGAGRSVNSKRRH